MSMPLLQRHYLKHFLKLFLITCAGLALILSLVDLVENLDEVLPQAASVQDIFLFPLFNLPKYLSYIMPLAALLSSLYTLGQASRKKEIVAIMAGGGRVKRLLIPFILTGVILSLLGFALNEFVVPDASRKAKDIKRSSARPGRSIFSKGTIWLRAKDGSIVRMGIYLPDRDMAREVSVFELKDGALRRRIEAEEAAYESGAWALKNAVVYDMENTSVEKLKAFNFPHLEPPEFLEEDVRSPEEMGLMELISYVRKLDEAGLRNVKLVVDMHSKMSYPLTNLFMLIIGISFSVRRGLGGLLAGAVGILISLLYWFGYSMSLSLGYASILPPFAAAWLAPVLFSAIAVYLFMTVPE
ncbi:MAG: LPS export ABC transporter permease LptG [Thermodesulfovibrionales bacterium]|nr:LPS export ABC transporter permease LptG [Thermodesulfovibrionales bacterium]